MTLKYLLDTNILSEAKRPHPKMIVLDTNFIFDIIEPEQIQNIEILTSHEWRTIRHRKLAETSLRNPPEVLEFTPSLFRGKKIS